MKPIMEELLTEYIAGLMIHNGIEHCDYEPIAVKIGGGADHEFQCNSRAHKETYGKQARKDFEDYLEVVRCYALLA